MILGLATVVYQVRDLATAKEWYTNAFGVEPYFDEPYYVGFNIRGYELGLTPDGAGVGPGGSIAYWRVPNIDRAVDDFLKAGATVVEPAQEVGGDIKVATVADPDGNLIGIIENPHFKLPE